MGARIFISATGTDAGKTWVSSALCRAARLRGLSVMAAKPVMSGFAPDNLHHSDAALLARACALADDPDSLKAICPWHFTAPLAPHHAAKAENIVLEFSQISRWCREKLAENADFSLIEGAGGLLSPITGDALNLTLAEALDLPVLLVVPALLGSVTHSLALLKLLQKQLGRIRAIIINDVHGNAALADMVAADIRRFAPLPCPPLVHVDHGSDTERSGDDAQVEQWCGTVLDEIL